VPKSGFRRKWPRGGKNIGQWGEEERKGRELNEGEEGKWRRPKRNVLIKMPKN
jgi:hypothetical protein